MPPGRFAGAREPLEVSLAPDSLGYRSRISEEQSDSQRLRGLPVGKTLDAGAAADPTPVSKRLAFMHCQNILKQMLNYLDALDRTFQALADPTRREIVERLSRHPATVSELARPQAMTLPAVMQHLSVLEASGLVLSEKVGRVRTCRINHAGLEQAERWIARRREEWEQRFDRLGQYLENVQKQGGEDDAKR